jgi:plastocyanin
MPARFVLALLAALAAPLAASACGGGGDDSAPAASPTAPIDVTATDFALAPATVSLDAAGTVTLRLVNEGGTTHALELEGGGVEQKTSGIGPGKSAELRVELKPGTYELYCPIGNHRSLGMDGQVLVAGASPGSGGTTTTDESDSGGYGYG